MKTSHIKKNVWIFVVGWVLLLAVNQAASAGEIGETLLDVMEVSGTDDKIPVIIRFVDKDPPDNGNQVAANKLAELLQNNAAASQGLIKALLRSQGITQIVSLWIINGIAVELTVEQIWSVVEHPDVKSIVLDDIVPAPQLFEVSPETTVSAHEGAWDNLGAIQAPALWNEGFIGTHVVVATMDTGVDYHHPDLYYSWRGGENSWYDPSGEHSMPSDKTGHGTGVMGILVGGDSGGTPIGVAPGAMWIAVKIFNDAGYASYSNIHLGYQWLLDPDGKPNTKDAPHIVNNSWGLSNAQNQCVTEFQQDIQVLKSAGIAVVFSGGNYGPSPASTVSPANYPESFAAGAVDRYGNVASFSSRGPSACSGTTFPDVVAPGVDILTSDKTYGGLFPDSYALVKGTSFAAPHVAGAMALLVDAFPGASPGDLERALMNSAMDIAADGPDNDTGFGLISVLDAYHMMEVTEGTCFDNDGDGFYATEDCGLPVDCNDNDPDVYPGAPEVKHDGIDQDCNGYDLTIDIVKADYVVKDDKLDVEATSALGQNASLVLENYGSMKWDRKNIKWTISVRKAGGNPGVVAVSGIEGTETASTKVDNLDDSNPVGKPKKN